MSLDTSKLENVRKTSGKAIARCPACAEEGKDKKGDHLFIEPAGRFGCIVYLGPEGERHRKRIFQLAGIREKHPRTFLIKPPSLSSPKTTTLNILGRLGRLSFTHAGTSSHLSVKDNDPRRGSQEPVPSVPNTTFTPEEQRLLTGIDAADLEQIALVKNLFNGTVVSVRDKKLNDLGKNQRKK